MNIPFAPTAFPITGIVPDSVQAGALTIFNPPITPITPITSITPLTPITTPIIAPITTFNDYYPYPPSASGVVAYGGRYPAMYTYSYDRVSPPSHSSGMAVYNPTFGYDPEYYAAQVDYLHRKFGHHHGGFGGHHHHH